MFSRNEDVLRRYREEYHVRKTYSDLNEAMNSSHDIMDMVMPHYMHRDLATRAMRNKKHVMIEKPIATTLEEARDMITESRNNKVKFMVAEQYYFDSSLRHAIQYLKEGLIGKVHTIIVRSQWNFQELDGWRTSEKLMGGGALIDGGIHFIEALLDLGGEYRDLESRVYKGKASIEGEDNTVSLIRFKSGATGIFYYSWNYMSPPDVPAYEVIGTKGSIYEYRGERDNISSHRPNTAFGVPVLNGRIQEIEEVDVFDAEISGFLKAVEKNEEVPYSPELAYRDLETVLMIYENAK
ncbi:MAG: Gfo/Idh/MocA family oxidoreductase [Candidatus Thermoplasmatota archaeon]|nr:Gfo/Idh/MocA family oxidoreductase [Candidatus Thermoplasmatota archaeon]